MSDFTMLIGGASVAAATTFDVVNPATEEVVAQAPECSPEQLDAAMDAAREAFPDWAREPERRRDMLLEAADRLEAIAGELTPLLTSEQGKPLGDAAFETMLPARWLRHFAATAFEPEVLQDDDVAVSTLYRRPIGVVSAISSWNFPVYQAIEKLAPALATGNTVVLKPSPYTPLTSLRIGEVLRDALPPGVVNIVSGGDELGRLMTVHPVPRMISFTGSIATGEKVAAASVAGLKRVKLELGGNDAAILLDDIDIEAVAYKLFWVAFGNCGQICNAVKRVYVPDALHDDLVEALAVHARAVTVGDPTAEGTQLGPINNRRQFERVKELTRDALAAGATAVTGGGPREGKGYFFEPTLLTGVGDGVRVVDEEQFGPVLPVVSYGRLEDAVRRANGTPYGLSASIWTADTERAAALLPQLDVQTVHVNAHMIGGERIPYGGVKSSGLGVANGVEGVLGYTEPFVVNQARSWVGVELPSALDGLEEPEPAR